MQAVLERVPGLRGWVECRRAKREAWEAGRDFVEENRGMALLLELAEEKNLRNPSFWQSRRGSSPYALVLHWEAQNGAGKGVALEVVDKAVKVFLSCGFGFWNSLDSYPRYGQYLEKHQLKDSDLSLEAKVRLAQDFAVEVYNQKPGEVKMVGAVHTQHLERIARFAMNEFL